MRNFWAAAIAIVLALGVGACGGDDPVVGTGGEQPTDAPSLQHIHGLGVDPGNGTLYVATHSGLFSAPDGEQQLQPVGDSRQDTMGFSVVRADRFIGSGHPDPEDPNLPPNLGLIESRDGGRTWKNLSLLGKADFHVLRASADRIYGFDGTQGRLMVSSDGGRGWSEHAPPGGVFDIAIDPRDADRIVASTDRGVFASADAGKGWRPLRDDTAGLLAWPAGEPLYLVDGQGQVQTSANGGRRWRPAGDIGGQPVAFVAGDTDLYVALADGTIKRSTDRGGSWSLRAAA